MQQEQGYTSIGKNIVFTSSIETTYFVVFLIASGEGLLSYSLQVSGDPQSYPSVQVLPLSPYTLRRPEEKISFKISLRRPKEKDIFIACNASDAYIVKLYRTPHTSPHFGVLVVHLMQRMRGPR